MDGIENHTTEVERLWVVGTIQMVSVFKWCAISLAVLSLPVSRTTKFQSPICVFFGCCCDVLCLKPYGQGLLWLWFTVWKRRWRWRIGRGGAGLPGLRIVDLIRNAHTKIIITITGVWKGAQEFWVSKSFHEKVAKELITPRFLSKHILDYHFYI